MLVLSQYHIFESYKTNIYRVGVPLLARGGRGLYEQKLLKYRILVAVSAIWAQLPRRQVAYGYMGCSAMCHLGSIFW
jgi:hypothetical protein